MFTLLLDRPHRVLMARLSGICSSEDLQEMDVAQIRYLSQDPDPDTVRAIYDYHLVDAMAAPRTRIAERAAQPPVIRGPRVLVAYPTAPHDFGVTFNRIQIERFKHGIAVVRTLPEAFALLGLDKPDFQPVRDI